MPRPLSDRQRIEIAIPCRLYFALGLRGAFEPNPKAAPEEGRREVQQATTRLKTLLAQANDEPLADLTPKDRGKITRRIERVTDAAVHDWDGLCALRVAMALHFFLETLIERGILVLWEGTPMGEAVSMQHPMFERGFEEPTLEHAARKQARRLMERYQAAGFYLDPVQPTALEVSVHA